MQVGALCDLSLPGKAWYGQCAAFPLMLPHLLWRMVPACHPLITPQQHCQMLQSWGHAFVAQRCAPSRMNGTRVHGVQSMCSNLKSRVTRRQLHHDRCWCVRNVQVKACSSPEAGVQPGRLHMRPPACSQPGLQILLLLLCGHPRSSGIEQRRAVISMHWLILNGIVGLARAVSASDKSDSSSC